MIGLGRTIHVLSSQSFNHFVTPQSHVTGHDDFSFTGAHIRDADCPVLREQTKNLHEHQNSCGPT